MKKIKVLISEEKINNRLDELANQIMDEYKGKDIVFLCILKGSIFFTVELAKRINLRNTPELVFELDESLEYGAKIENIINELNRK